MFLDEDEDFAPGTVRLARIGPRLVLCERPGDRAKGKPRRFTAYQVDEIEPGVPFKLDPDAASFVLSERAFYWRSDWELTLLADPAFRYNDLMLTIWAALEPLLLANYTP